MGFACQHLKKEFYTRKETVLALDDVSFNVGESEFVCIVGPSGCGKTTLLRLIDGLLRPTSGRVVFDTQSSNGRLRTALVFQTNGLFPWMTVLDNVAFGLEMQGVAKKQAHEQTRAFIANVGLDSFANSFPHELSVGMCQRVGIARAFAADPETLLMDEPFGALDAQTRLVLQEELLRIWKDNQKSVVHITHDIDEAILLGDRVIVMTGRPGRIREIIPIPLGRPRDLSMMEQPIAREIKWRIWRMLEDEVRKSLSMTGQKQGRG